MFALGCHDAGVSEPAVTVYTEQDQPGFAELVNTIHAEFGFGFDPLLDADLEHPTSYYQHLWLVRLGSTVVGSAALTPPDNRVTTLKRMYLRPEHRRRGVRPATSRTRHRDGPPRGLHADQPRYQRSPA